MITIDFSQRENLSLTEYLYSQLKKMIGTGEIQGNEKLPSKRALATHLGVSIITIKNAYERLIAEGYVYSAEKKGYFVTPLESTYFIEKPKKIIQTNQTDFSQNQDFINLQGNSVNQNQFPFSLWAKLFRQSLKESKEKILSPLPAQGLLELRIAIANHLAKFRNLVVNPEQIIVGAGTEYLYTLLVQLLGKNCRFAVENPGYKKTSAIFEANGAFCFPIEMDNSGLLPQKLNELKIDAIHVSPAHHFPTGIVMPIRRRQELLNWAYNQNTFIIEDDYDSEFRFDGRPLDTLFSMDNNERVIYLNTFTKSISPSLRISYMVLPENLVQEFRNKLGFYSCTVSSIEQLTLASFISGGWFEKHLIRMKNYYKNLRNLLINELNKSPLKSIMTITEKDAGLHFLMQIDSDMNDADISKILYDNKIKISFLSEYFYNTNTNNGTMVINYSGLKKNQITQLVEILCKVFVQN